MSEFKNVYEGKSRNLQFLFSKIRAVETSPKDFAFYAMRLMKLIAEDGLAMLGGQGRIFTMVFRKRKLGFKQNFELLTVRK